MAARQEGLAHLLTKGPWEPYLIGSPDSEGLRIYCYRRSCTLSLLYTIGSLATLGLLFVLCKWNAELKAALKYRRCPASQATVLLVQPTYGSSVLTSVTQKLISFQGVGAQLSKDLRPLVLFEFRQERYRYIEEKDCFEQVGFPCGLPYNEVHSLLGRGIEDELTLDSRRSVYGSCLQSVPVPTVYELLSSEVFNPFFLFQFFSTVLWFYENYRLYAGVIIVMTVASLANVVRETRREIDTVQKRALYRCRTRVFRPYLRKDRFVEISSEDLVPGDLMQISAHQKLPCDLILLNGTCVVNEGMLTGESTSVLKDPLPAHSQGCYTSTLDRKHTLHGGTTVLEARRGAVGVVVAVGFSTTEGQLIRSILYPKPNRFRFFEESIMFVVLLGCIALLGSALALRVFLLTGVSFKDSIVTILDLITIAVPPTLPLVMILGPSYARTRLNKAHIKCTSLHAINAAGRVSLVCFDKTGTLTDNSLEVAGLVSREEGELRWFAEDIGKVMQGQLRNSLVCCQTLAVVDGNVTGDPQETSIHYKLGMELTETDEKREVSLENSHFEVIQSYYFTSLSKRMGVVVREASSNCLYLYMKGAPEVIADVCNSIPTNYHEAVQMYSRQGFRILAYAYKSLANYSGSESLSELEGGLDLLGLVVFRNKLRPEAGSTVTAMRQAAMRVVISTGDNMLTAIAIALESGAVPDTYDIYMGDTNSQMQDIDWEKYTSDGKMSFQRVPMSDWVDRLKKEDCSFAFTLTSRAFEFLVKSHHRNPTPYLRFILTQVVVCARMSPSQKVDLVNAFQAQGALVAMCGDGANDCGALKTADVGLSLSSEEAAIAAPFVGKDLNCLEVVIKEGRAALVSSFQAFKFIALYSMIQFMSTNALYLLETTFLDIQFLYVDLFTVIPLTYVMSYSSAYHKISKRQPPGSLISASVVASLLGQILLHALFLLIGLALLAAQDWFEPQGNGFTMPSPGYENTTVFLISNMQYISMCVALSIGPPFRISAYRNYRFVLTMLGISSLNCYLLLGPDQYTRDFMGVSAS